jgi:hypothetical protein
MKRMRNAKREVLSAERRVLSGEGKRQEAERRRQTAGCGIGIEAQQNAIGGPK